LLQDESVGTFEGGTLSLRGCEVTGAKLALDREILIYQVCYEDDTFVA
jgi:hypothetical protein